MNLKRFIFLVSMSSFVLYLFLFTPVITSVSTKLTKLTNYFSPDYPYSVYSFSGFSMSRLEAHFVKKDMDLRCSKYLYKGQSVRKTYNSRTECWLDVKTALQGIPAQSVSYHIENDAVTHLSYFFYNENHHLVKAHLTKLYGKPFLIDERFFWQVKEGFVVLPKMSEAKDTFTLLFMNDYAFEQHWSSLNSPFSSF